MQSIKLSLERDRDQYDLGLADPLKLVEFASKAKELIRERKEKRREFVSILL